jgi:hypothetical protein
MRSFRKPVYKFNVSLNLTKITGTLHEDVHAFTSSPILLIMKNIADKINERFKRNILCSIFFLKSVYELMWINVLEPYSPQRNTVHAHCMLDN